jgi:hypothetical protein
MLIKAFLCNNVVDCNYILASFSLNAVRWALASNGSLPQPARQPARNVHAVDALSRDNKSWFNQFDTQLPH